jgi:hypothetical protein
MTTEKQEYLYNFVGGGWNSEYAHSVEEAIFQAKNRWSDSSNSEIDETSFRVSSKDDYNALLRLAY